jgi:hypothetical protein
MSVVTQFTVDTLMSQHPLERFTKCLPCSFNDVIKTYVIYKIFRIT